MAEKLTTTTTTNSMGATGDNIPTKKKTTAPKKTIKTSRMKNHHSSGIISPINKSELKVLTERIFEDDDEGEDDEDGEDMAHAEDTIDGDVEDIVKNEELRAFLTLENIKDDYFDDFVFETDGADGAEERTLAELMRNEVKFDPEDYLFSIEELLSNK